MDKRAIHPRWVVACVIMGTTTVSLNNSTINPAVPVFIDEFNLSPMIATWIIVIFMTLMGVTMPLTHYLSSQLGRKSLYLLGIGLFFIGSFVGMVAQDITQVLIARGIQGAASGLVIPLSLAIIYSVYPKENRGSVSGIWGAAVMLSPAVGPVMGGVILTYFSWKALFLFNLPIALTTLIMGLKVLPTAPRDKTLKFDGVGYLLIAFGFGLILVAAAQMRTLATLTDIRYLLAMGMGVLLLAGFIYWSLHRDAPLLNVKLFQIKGYRSSVIIAVAQAVGMFESLFLLPLLLQLVMGLSPSMTGMVLCATAISASIGSRMGGKMLDQQGANRVVTLGLVATSLGTIGFGFVTVHTSLWILFSLALVRGAGIGLSYIPITTAGMNTLPEDMVTQGAVMNNLSRRLCASLALICGAIWIEFSTTGHAADFGVHSQQAIHELFLFIGLLIGAVIPVAWRFPQPPLANGTQTPSQHIETPTQIGKTHRAVIQVPQTQMPMPTTHTSSETPSSAAEPLPHSHSHSHRFNSHLTTFYKLK